jgi:hypothetical protein
MTSPTTNFDDDTTAHGGGEINSGRSARERAIDAFDGARENVGGALAEAPLLVLAGGIAAGAVIAALLPRTQGEKRLVKPYARRAKDSARAAFKAARDTGKERFDELGYTREKGQEQLRNLLDSLKDTAKASADAAAAAVRGKD